MHFFVTYEGKEFETPQTVTLGQGIPSSAAPPELQPLLGVVSAPFDEDLYFGKIDWSVADDHLLELTGKHREESEISSIGDQNTSQFASNKENDEYARRPALPVHRRTLPQRRAHHLRGCGVQSAAGEHRAGLCAS